MKKKIQFPKIKKHLQNFLTDESGKISKHNALGFGAAGALIGLLDGADAHHQCGGGGGRVNSWSGGGGGTYYSPGTCGHASSILNTFRSEIAPLSGTSITKGSSLPLSGTNNGSCISRINVGTSTTFYRNCGIYSSNVRGHMSNMGATGNATETTTHTNTHSNY